MLDEFQNAIRKKSISPSGELHKESDLSRMIGILEQSKTNKSSKFSLAKLFMVTSDHGIVLTCMNLLNRFDTACKTPQRIGYVS